MCINLVVFSQYAALNWRDTTTVNMGSVRCWLRTGFPHIKWVVHNFPIFEEAEFFCQESPIHDYSFGRNQPKFRSELTWHQDVHRRIYSIKTEFGRNISITCCSNVKRLRITKLGRISLQDMCIELVVISQYAALNWRDTTSANMGSVRWWQRIKLCPLTRVVHNFTTISKA